MRSSSLFVSLCAIITLSGCAYIIPPDPSTPRHNTVLGGPRRPQLNLISGPLSALPTQPSAPTVAAAPVEPVAVTAQNYAPAAAPALPPVDPAVRAQAERELQASSVRALPPENQQFQVAGNYPALDSVPPRPALSGADSAQSRLSTTQSDLERERVEADLRKATLARDAAAEPSMLAPASSVALPVPVALPTPQAQPAVPAAVPGGAPTSLPPATIPADPRRAPTPGGANLAPIAPEPRMAAATPAPRITFPEPQPQSNAALPATPAFAPPAPLTVASLDAPARQPARTTPAQQPAPATVPMPVPVPVAAPVPSASTQAPRITLRPPVDYEATPVNLQLSPAPSPVPFGGITVQPGDFNPLTGGQHSSLVAPTQGNPIERSVTSSGSLAEYASSEAIAPSRYGTNRR